jgi:rare lipoprotein A
MASYYGNKFHGRRTSNGEVYDMYVFSAAHRQLPLPSFARVTNLENGQSVIVRVNDRGPFHAGRLIDLSYAAAVKLGITERGTGKVEVRALTPASASPATASSLVVVGTEKTTAPPVSTAPVWLQVASYASYASAENARARLATAGISGTTLSEFTLNGLRLWRLRVRSDVTSADALAQRISALGFEWPQRVRE